MTSPKSNPLRSGDTPPQRTPLRGAAIDAVRRRKDRAKVNRRRFWMTIGSPFRNVGGEILGGIAGLTHLMSVVGASWLLAMRPSSWTPPVRTVLVRQILFTAVDAIPITFRFGAAAGILLIVQTAIWADDAGISADVTPILWKGIVRELSPLLACLVVIGRSGIAMSTELATMRVGGELELMEAGGLDPMTCLVMPRVVAVVFSVCTLAMLLTVSMTSTGYVVGYLMQAIRIGPWEFAQQLAAQSQGLDLVFFVPKTLLASSLVGAVCCVDGLNVRDTMTDVPRVASRAGIHALTAVLIVSATLSVLIYGRLLVFEIVER